MNVDSSRSITRLVVTCDEGESRRAFHLMLARVYMHEATARFSPVERQTMESDADTR